MATIQGFKIISVAFDKSVKAPHFMYFKKHTHQKKNELMPSDRTIFVVNVPPYCMKRGLENIFGRYGPIEAIFIQDAPGPVQDAVEDGKNMIFSKEHFCFKVHYACSYLTRFQFHMIQILLQTIYHFAVQFSPK